MSEKEALLPTKCVFCI